MSEQLFRRCQHCRKTQRLDFETDGMGGVRVGGLGCGCEARRRRGVCLDCNSRVEGTRSFRCAPCKKAVKVRRLRVRREVVLERQRVYWKRRKVRYNAARRPAARRYSHDYGTKYVGIMCRPPTCRLCGDEVPYAGRGRPRLECPRCRVELEAEIEATRKPRGGRRGSYTAWSGG